MKKNLIYFLILLVVVVIAYFAFNKKKELFSKDDANFQVENVEEVTKVFLSDASVGNIVLTKKSDSIWYVNDSFLARQDWVDFLLKGMKYQNASQMVPKAMHNNTIKQLASSSVKVEIFKGDKKTHAFYVAKDPGKDNITIMLNIRPDGTNAPRPFFVKYGMGNTFLGVRYLTNIENWRDKQILNFPKNDIKQISVQYPAKPEYDFVLKTKPSISISPENKEGSQEINIQRAQTYIDFYEKLYCMGFENNYILKDTFVKTFTPLAQVTVTNTENEQKDLKVYYRQVGKSTHKILVVDGKEYDGDSFFGLLNNRDFVLLSSQTVSKILREHHEFFVGDTKPTTRND